ncbi:alkaline phosphatase family protein [Planotetraspora sp. GP83]|uniref:alkaline phosphatase family protein n=1 Tax=Planotetraspora sp. GP83 TaxID=3156264 RepID=UPI003511B9D1
MRALRALSPVLAAAALLTSFTGSPASADSDHGHGGHDGPRVVGKYHHLVVIYEENHSFDNLYGHWGRVDGRGIDGLAGHSARNATQVAQDGTPYGCLAQNDVNLATPPLAATCQDAGHGVAASHFANRPFTIDDYIKPTDKTCPPPDGGEETGVLKDSPGALPGGCTRDLVHRFYQEQYQIDHGKQDRYVTGSNAVGLTMGAYDTKSLPIWKYLHAAGAPNYVIADRFFQGSFGGSFLNHQYLIAGRAPIDTAAAPGGAQESLHSVVDANGFPNAGYPLYKPTGTVKDAQLTQACGPAANPGVACGDYAVNTIQPASTPQGGGARLPLIDDAKYPNIGDRLTGAGVDWAWYSGGWKDAEAGHPGPLFQFHHQPFNYFAAYAPGQPGRTHLKDETEFLDAAKKGTLPTVSFVKPYGAENEHPGYASEADGSDHLVDLLKTIESGPQADDTLVVVTYDEFGGTWDHVSPPGKGSRTKGAFDLFGPGTRIPALVVSRSLPHSGVDHTVYDTTSILATIERGLHLAPVGTRDGRVNDLSGVLHAAGAHH